MATERPRFVLDTNVLVSAALFPHSVPGQALALARNTGVLLASRDLLEEIRDVLSRPKFDRYVTPQIRDEFLVALITEVLLVEIVDHVDVCRDPKDNKVLEVAASGRAACVISGDDDLTILHPFRGIVILNPAEFISRLGEGQQ